MAQVKIMAEVKSQEQLTEDVFSMWLKAPGIAEDVYKRQA